MIQRNFQLAALLAVLVASVSGCATATQPEAKAAVPAVAAAPAQPVLSEAATQALAKAVADVKMAKAKFALWTTAEKALKDAQEAAKTGDSDKVLKAAAIVSSQVKAGLEQLNYPSTEI